MIMTGALETDRHVKEQLLHLGIIDTVKMHISFSR